VAGYLLAVVASSAYAPAFGSQAAELFPTSERGSVAGWLTAAGVLGAVAGLAVGLIVGSLIGLHAVLLACGLGALAGAFAGVMVGLHGGHPREATREHPVESRGGRMIAVCVDRAGTERLAIEALRANNARDVGVTHGEWRDGSWRDFDPRTPLATV
jgi:MFS family permease